MCERVWLIIECTIRLDYIKQLACMCIRSSVSSNSFPMSFCSWQLNVWKANFCDGMWTKSREVQTAGFLGKVAELQKSLPKVSSLFPFHVGPTTIPCVIRTQTRGWGPLPRVEHNVPAEQKWLLRRLTQTKTLHGQAPPSSPV